MKPSDSILNHVCSSLDGLPQGQAGQRAGEFARHYGVRKQTIFEWCKLRGIRWRTEKASKGKTACADGAIIQASALLISSKRSNNNIPLPACEAKEILEDSGIGPGISTSHFLALMREKQLSREDLLRPTPHQILRSEHPNHVWQFDVTNCLQYFLDEKGMGERDPDMELYKNKMVKTAKTIKKELLRYAAVDHCSGAFFFWYYYATGERAIDGADFLYRAMRPKDELIEEVWGGGSKTGKYHFHGVPFILVPDRGSIIVDKANQSLFKSLRIDVKPHLPGNPRAKGAVEGLMKIINAFEARLRFRRPRDLAELNSWALDWTVKKNGADLMRHFAPRSALWSKIRAEQLRLCPDREIYTMLARRPEVERTVEGDRIFRLKGLSYQIPDPNAAHHKIKIIINPYEYPAVEAHFNNYVWLCQPISKDDYGRLSIGVSYGKYKAIKQTKTEKAKTEMEKIAEGWGLKWKGTAQHRVAIAPAVGHESPLKVFGHQADKVKVDFINRKGTDLDVIPAEMPENKPLTHDAVQISKGIVDRRISMTEFFKRLIQRVGPISREMNQELRARFGESININDAEREIETIETGNQQPEGSRQKAVGSSQ